MASANTVDMATVAANNNFSDNIHKYKKYKTKTN